MRDFTLKEAQKILQLKTFEIEDTFRTTRKFFKSLFNSSTNPSTNPGKGNKRLYSKQDLMNLKLYWALKKYGASAKIIKKVFSVDMVTSPLIDQIYVNSDCGNFKLVINQRQLLIDLEYRMRKYAPIDLG